MCQLWLPYLILPPQLEAVILCQRQAVGVEVETGAVARLVHGAVVEDVQGGVVLQWPSLQAVVWLALYGLISHWMATTEEEHLAQVFGEEYQQYCAKVPRYVGIPK